jgi:hypothetical protein
MRGWIVLGGVAAVVGTGLTALLIGGCSSASSPYPDQNTFCLAKAESECNSPASTAAGGIEGVCGTASTCVNARQAVCNEYANAALAGGMRTYSPSGATACIAAVQSAYAVTTPAAASVPYSTLQQLNLTCEQGVFPGTVQAMGACQTSDDCGVDATGNPMICSPVNPGSKVLECATAIPVSAGQPCANFGSQCADGTYCLGSSTTPYTCQNGAPVGGSCTATHGCGTGAYCSTNAGETEGSCLAVSAQEGVACSSDVSCGGGGSPGSTPTTSFPYCDLSAKPTTGQGPGACTAGQGFSLGGADCSAFGGSSN